MIGGLFRLLTLVGVVLPILLVLALVYNWGGIDHRIAHYAEHQAKHGINHSLLHNNH